MRPAMLKFILTLLTLFAVSGSPLFAEDSGLISGEVKDADSGELLPGATVMIKGTYYGASTDLEGGYLIKNIKPGTYTMEVSLIGYTKLQKTGVEVAAAGETVENFELSQSQLVLGQDVVVIGEKPLLDIEATESRSIVTAQEIERAVVEDVTDIVSNQAGVVATGREIHIRGGRAYENSYLVDGVSIQDPFSGGTAGLSISANALEEVEILTGGFNAEYGQSMSGVIQVTTKEGSDRFGGSVTYKTDDLGLLDGNNTDITDVTVGGPIPYSKGKLSYFLSGYMNVSDTYLPHTDQLYSSIAGGSRWAPREANSYSGIAKLTCKFNPTHKLVFSYNRSLTIDQGYQSGDFDNPDPDFDSYPYRYQYNLENYNTITRDSNQESLFWTHTLSPKFFYEIMLSRFFTRLHSDVGGKHWSEYVAPTDILPINYFFVPDSDPTDSIDDSHYVGTVGDGFYDYGDGEKWHDHYVDKYTLKLNASYSPSTRHLFKSGLEFNYQEMQMVDIYQPWSGRTGLGLNHDIYKVYPNFGAFFLQDKVTFKGLILNLGARLDWWFPGEYVDRAIEDTTITAISEQMRRQYREDTFDLFGRRGKAHLSPRIGISHPVSERMMLFYSYGHFSKLPRPQRVYAKLGGVSESTYQLFGNPNLSPETTVAYELGLRYEVTQDDVLGVTAYYKDIFDYISALTITTSGRTGTTSYLMYFNLDYARSRGVELEYKKRKGKHLSLTLQTSYSVATGKSSSPKDELLVAKGKLEEKSIKENYLAWDRPLRFSVDLNVHSAKREPITLLGVTLPDYWNLYLRFFAQSGKRYTSYTKVVSSGGVEQYIANSNDPYGEVAKNWIWVDLRFKKYFDLWKVKYTLFCEVTNLFDYQNSKIINPLTGKAYQYGDPVLDTWNDPLNPDPDPVYPFPFNPARYLEPRSVKVGMSVEF
jgi:outer membrane receptor protein involved in Fe transport